MKTRKFWQFVAMSSSKFERESPQLIVVMDRELAVDLAHTIINHLADPMSTSVTIMLPGHKDPVLLKERSADEGST